jgi:hypothetical protein
MEELQYIQGDSKLMSGLPWPVIFKSEKIKMKLFAEYQSITQEVLFGNAILAALISGRKYDVIPKNGDG